MQIKTIYINHKEETYATLTAAQALEFLMTTDEAVQTYGDAFGSIAEIGEDIRIEYFKSNTFVPFEDYYQRINSLKESGYADISDWFDQIAG